MLVCSLGRYCTCRTASRTLGEGEGRREEGVSHVDRLQLISQPGYTSDSKIGDLEVTLPDDR